MSVPIPDHPLEILTPAPISTPPPSAHTLSLLRQLCDTHVHFASDETYSVTNSVLLCPEGKNHLFTLKPYYWETEPGVWVHRDGKRNPYCDSPGGQKQLQKMARAVHCLALGAAHLPDLAEGCLARVEQLLRVFFVDEDTRMVPEVMYAQCRPGDIPLKGDYAFEIAIRFIILVDHSLRLISDRLDPELADAMKFWITRQAEWMKTCEQAEDVKRCDDNKTVWYHAILATHLSVTSLTDARSYATTFFDEWSATHPTPEQCFARDRRRTRPRHYALFMLEPLFILADLSRSSASSALPADVKAYMEEMVRYAKTTEPGEMERPLEEEGRYERKMAWFERMLDRWAGVREGELLGKVEPDGEGWEGGWDLRMMMVWGFV
ncbi:hypothetical protein IAT38_005494 [Cryptococcus sp. DSM 104549]